VKIPNSNKKFSAGTHQFNTYPKIQNQFCYLNFSTLVLKFPKGMLDPSSTKTQGGDRFDRNRPFLTQGCTFEAG